MNRDVFVSNPIRESQNSKQHTPHQETMFSFKPYKGKSKFTSWKSSRVCIPVSNPIRESQNTSNESTLIVNSSFQTL